MFVRSSSKKTLTMSSILLLLVGCVCNCKASSSSSAEYLLEAYKRVPDGSEDTGSGSTCTAGTYSTGSSSSQTYKNRNYGWGLFKLLFGDWKHSALTVGFLILFALGMVAMFADFTQFHAQAGNMLFGDEGSSMWLRLAIAIPCLTLPCVAISVVFVRAHQKAKFGDDSEGYKEWKSQGIGYGKDKFSRGLQYIFCCGLLVFAFIACYFGSLKNAGEGMYLVAWILPASVGVLGLGFVIVNQILSHKREFGKKCDELSAIRKDRDEMRDREFEKQDVIDELEERQDQEIEDLVTLQNEKVKELNKQIRLLKLKNMSQQRKFNVKEQKMHKYKHDLAQNMKDHRLSLEGKLREKNKLIQDLKRKIETQKAQTDPRRASGGTDKNGLGFTMSYPHK